MNGNVAKGFIRLLLFYIHVYYTIYAAMGCNSLGEKIDSRNDTMLVHVQIRPRVQNRNAWDKIVWFIKSHDHMFRIDDLDGILYDSMRAQYNFPSNCLLNCT